MLDKALKFWFKHTGKKHLIPFLDGMLNSGRPSANFFPTELIDQGLGLAMSGLNNTLTIMGNLNWVWPAWYEQQRNPISNSFIPTGANMMTANVGLRNWVSMGNPNSNREFMVDPVGMLTPGPWKHSVFPYLRINNKDYYPPLMVHKVKQYWLEDSTPVLRSEYLTQASIGWFSDISALDSIQGEFAWIKNFIENRSDQTQIISFGLALRPYNALTLGHINHIYYDKRNWFINRKSALIIFDEPHEIRISNRFSGDPLSHNNRQKSFHKHKTKSGFVSGVCEWQFVLEPGEHKTFEAMLPFAKKKTLAADFVNAGSNSVLISLKKKSDAVWNEISRTGMKIKLPDSKLEKVFYHLKKHLLVFDDGTHFSPGTYIYHEHWIRDSYFLALAYMRMGLFDRVAPKIDNLFKNQMRSGFFKSQDGEWDSNGQALKMICDFSTMTGNADPILFHKKSMVKSALWVDEFRTERDDKADRHGGLLPPGFSAEHFGPNDYYFWDNFWNLAGLDELVRIMQILGESSDTLTRITRKYRHDIDFQLKSALNLNNGLLSSSPYRHPDAASVGVMVAASPLGLFPANTPWMKQTADFLFKNHTQDGMFFQQIIHTGLNAYLSTHLATVLMFQGDPRWKVMLNSIIEKGGRNLTWPEAINPRTQGGCMGDGDHGWACADVLGLLRNMLVAEDGKNLVLGAGFSEDWFEPGKVIQIQEAETFFGSVSYKLSIYLDKIEFEYEIKRNFLQKPVPIFLFLPEQVATNFNLELLSEYNRPGVILTKAEGSLTFSKEQHEHTFEFSNTVKN
jgi:hypothetical protein